MVKEDYQMKINHVWPILISINPIWLPIRVKILHFLAGITPNKLENGEYLGLIWHKWIA